MPGIPDHNAVGFWLVGFFWAAAALCFVFDGGAGELVIPLLSMGALTALAKYVMRNES